MKDFPTRMSSLKKLIAFLLPVLFVSIFTVCSDDDDDDKKNTSLKKNTTTEYSTPKYIFYFIGDGMASVQITATEAALSDNGFRLAKVNDPTLGELEMSKFPVAGMATTHAENRFITGSAAAATALATGHKTTINTISKNGTRTQDFKTMAEMARDKGMRVGIVSSVSIDHATPACFYAHEDTRKNYYNIAKQMSTSEFDYFAGGYAKGNFDSKRGSETNIERLMEDAGYTITKTRSELQAVPNGSKCWAYTGYDNDGALYYEIDRPENHISLAEFTQKGIELLDNENGFFIMVEAGKVDWACHANDVVSSLKDMIAFDESIAKAVQFYEQHPDETLIIITGDHECGGLTLGFANTGYDSAFDLLKHQKLSYQAFSGKVVSWADNGSVTFEMVLDSLNDYFGLGNTSLSDHFKLSAYDSTLLLNAYNKSMKGEAAYDDYEELLRYGPNYDPITVTATHLLNQKAGIDWTSYYHTGVPVPVLAKGQGQYEFSGYYDNTDIAKKIIEIGQLNSSN